MQQRENMVIAGSKEVLNVNSFKTYITHTFSKKLNKAHTFSAFRSYI